MSNVLLENEAEIFGKYFLNQSPTSIVKGLYSHAILTTAFTISVKDQKLLKFIINNNWSIGLIDSGLAFLTPDSEVRRRLYILFAILESSPTYCDIFLPRKRSLLYLITILFCGCRAILKTLVGSLLVKVIV